MIEVADLGADVTADKLITWVDKKPRKIPNTVFFLILSFGTPSTIRAI